MGIKFDCKHCGHSLHVKDHLAGKRGICPHCQGKVDIPALSDDGASVGGVATASIELRTAIAEPTTQELVNPVVGNGAAGAPAVVAPTGGVSPSESIAHSGDSIAEAPHLQWYVLPPGSMTKYGPAAGNMMRAWLTEGRVPADALVWREGWPQWRPAATVFPQLRQAPTQQVAVAVVQPHPTAAAPVVAEPVAAVELGFDDPGPAKSHAGQQRPGKRTARNQRNVIVGLLVTLFVVFLAVLIYVLLNQ